MRNSCKNVFPNNLACGNINNEISQKHRGRKKVEMNEYEKSTAFTKKNSPDDLTVARAYRPPPGRYSLVVDELHNEPNL